MKQAFAVVLLAALLAPAAPAQDAPVKPPRKSFFFLPGRKAPEPTPLPITPMPVATPRPTPKATPKPTPKSTPRSTPKPTPKATPKPATPAPPKATPPAEPTAAEKLRSTSVESVAPMPATPPPAPKATPIPKATPPPVEPPAKTSTAGPEEKFPQIPPSRGAAAIAAGAAMTAPASPAIITSTVPPEPAQIVRAFFGSLGKGDIDGAYASLMKGSKIGDRPEEVRTLKAKTKDAIDIFGVMHGYDLVDIKPVGERLMRATYLSLGHELPLRWRFYFYKAEADWKLIDLRVDDKLTGIFDEAMEEVPRPEARP